MDSIINVFLTCNKVKQVSEIDRWMRSVGQHSYTDDVGFDYNRQATIPSAIGTKEKGFRTREHTMDGTVTNYSIPPQLSHRYSEKYHNNGYIGSSKMSTNDYARRMAQQDVMQSDNDDARRKREANDIASKQTKAKNKSLIDRLLNRS